MDNLALTLARHPDCDIRAVRANLAACLAYRGAAEAARLLRVRAVSAEVAALCKRTEVVRIHIRGNGTLEVGTGNGPCNRLCIGDGLDDRGRTAAAVACCKDMRNGRLEALIHDRAALLIHPAARRLVDAVIDPLADRGNHGRGRNLARLARRDRTAASGLVGGAQLHNIAGEHAVSKRHWRQELEELDAVGERLSKLFLVCRHIALRAAIDEADMLDTGNALGSTGNIHRGIAAAHDDDIRSQGKRIRRILEGREELKGVKRLAVLESWPAFCPGTDCNDDIRIALAQELGGILDFLAVDELCAVGGAELDILVDRGISDAEGRNDMTDDAASLLRALEDGDIGTGTRQERGSRKTGRASTHDSDLLVRHIATPLELRHDLREAFLCCLELQIADVDMLLVVVPHAAVSAGMRADRARRERKRVALEDDLESVGIPALADRTDVARYVLTDRAVFAAGCREAIDEGKRACDVAVRQRLDGLAIARTLERSIDERMHGSRIDAREWLIIDPIEHLGNLAEACIAAGLELVCSHRHRPDAGIDERIDAVRIGTARIGDAELSVKLVGDAGGQRERERIERASGHIHLAARQLSPRHIDRERIRELHAELEATLCTERRETPEHRHGILPLEVLVEVMLVEDDVVEAEGIERLPGILIAQKRRVALDVGIEAFLRDEVGCDALDLIRRAAMERRLRDGVRDMRRDGGDECLIDILEAVEIALCPDNSLLEGRRACGVHHLVDEGIDLLGLDALEVVADRHVEDEAVRIAEAELLCQELYGNPGLHVLAEGIVDRELRRPLAVVALIRCQDARLVHAGRELCAIHLLDGLELEEARARHIGSDDVLCKLRVGAGCRTVGRLDLLVEDRTGMARALLHDAGLAEDRALLCIFRKNPVHQLRKRHRTHDIAHVCSSLKAHGAPRIQLLLPDRARNGRLDLVGLAVEVSPEPLGLLEDVGIDSFLVSLDELAVTVEDLAGNDRRRAVLALEAEEHVAVDVGLGDRRERAVVENRDIGCSTRLERADPASEVL